MKDPVSMRNLYLGGIALLVVGVIVILLVFSGVPQIEAKDPVYSNGILTTKLTYNGEEPVETWIQFEILKEDGLFSSEHVGTIESYFAELKEGQSAVINMPVILDSGKYKIFIYVLEKDEPYKRIIGFIKYVDVI